MKSRKVAKAEAESTAKSLTELAVRTSAKDMEVAKAQAELARRVALRYNVRLDYSLKRFTCHGCKKLLIPGANARVRIKPGDPLTIRITCLDCGRVNRKMIRHP